MRKSAITAALMLTTALAACSPQVLVYQGRHAQKLDPMNSMIGRACDGLDNGTQLQLSGSTWLTADFHVASVDAGFEHPYGAISGSVTRGISQMVAPIYSGHEKVAECTGMAVRTIVRRERSNVFMDWTLELTPPLDQTVGLPADPWTVSGHTLIPASGYADDMVAFHLAGRPMIVRLKVSPGTVWVEKQNAERIKEMNATHPMSDVATPLPDEQPGRTLEDATNPAFKQ